MIPTDRKEIRFNITTITNRLEATVELRTRYGVLLDVGTEFFCMLLSAEVLSQLLPHKNSFDLVEFSPYPDS